MPNYCDYKMKVRGIPEKVEEFIIIMQATDYEKQRHMYRIFDADIIYDITGPDNIRTVLIDGYCAWSVYCCMMEGPCTYYTENIENDVKNLDTSLIIESKRLGLVIEAFSDEPGVGFQEHIYINNNGNILVSECKDCYTYWLGEIDTWEQYIEDVYGDTKADLERANQDPNMNKDIFDRCKLLGLDIYKVGGYEVDGEFRFFMDNNKPFCNIVR